MITGSEKKHSVLPNIEEGPLVVDNEAMRIVGQSDQAVDFVLRIAAFCIFVCLHQGLQSMPPGTPSPKLAVQTDRADFTVSMSGPHSAAFLMNSYQGTVTANLSLLLRASWASNPIWILVAFPISCTIHRRSQYSF